MIALLATIGEPNMVNFLTSSGWRAKRALCTAASVRRASCRAAARVVHFTMIAWTSAPYAVGMSRISESGAPIEGVYGPKDVQHLDPVTDLG